MINPPMALSDPPDDYLSQLIRARDRSAVLKTRFLTFKSGCPGALIFVFEGVTDKIVYYHWIKRINPSITYEALPLDGKGNVLSLYRIVQVDKANLAAGVYFFVDRDFDDLRGVIADMRIFMTELYSVENYLVSKQVLNEVLSNDFHCSGLPKLREDICCLFERTYERFLEVTKPLNLRIFIARKLGIELLKPLPSSARSLAIISLRSVDPAEKPIGEMVAYKTSSEGLETSKIHAEFEALEPSGRYRGKFALAFFSKWLLALVDEYDEKSSAVFSSIDRKHKVRRDEFGVGIYATKSPLPVGLASFIGSIP